MYAKKGAAKKVPVITPDERAAATASFLSGPGGSWIAGLEEAPVFRPSAAEWADPIAYIRAIQGSFKAAGAARIVPPVLPCAPGPAVVGGGRPGWRYGVRQQFVGGTLASFDEARQQIWESGKTLTLQEHERKANAYARRVFGTSAPMPPRVVEAEYWRELAERAAAPRPRLPAHASSPVLYGNDVEGSAFSSRPDDALAASGWNLGAISCAPGSSLRLLGGAPIPGVTSPMLYIGMLGATFCWHVEDHQLYSINYHHWGAPKVWYAVPASHADAFEDAAAVEAYAAPSAAAAAAGAGRCEVAARVLGALMLKSTMVAPGALLARGVRVVRAVQQPGEYVITLPRSYHGGFSTGFNCGEAAAARLRRLGVDHILPTEQLLVAEARSAADGLFAADGLAALAAAAAAGGAGGAAAGGGGLEPGPALVLRCFLRHMRRQHARRRAVARRGAGAAWLGAGAPDSLPCVGCREPAYLGVVMDRGSGQCYCLRCGAARRELAGPGAVALLRRCMPALEELARRLEELLRCPPCDDPWAASAPDPLDCGGLGPDGLTESARHGSDESGSLLGPAEAAAAAAADAVADPFNWDGGGGWPAAGDEHGGGGGGGAWWEEPGGGESGVGGGGAAAGGASGGEQEQGVLTPLPGGAGGAAPAAAPRPAGKRPGPAAGDAAPPHKLGVRRVPSPPSPPSPHPPHHHHQQQPQQPQQQQQQQQQPSPPLPLCAAVAPCGGAPAAPAAPPLQPPQPPAVVSASGPSSEDDEVPLMMRMATQGLFVGQQELMGA
ncbi:MAG: JmjC domain, hydroxylase-domain-containing protein [Monoraphidium minutum]|nr:MAG: JmjC domain, hydroxylase-domain-containing protein [Monoraphidium minutum]